MNREPPPAWTAYKSGDFLRTLKNGNVNISDIKGGQKMGETYWGIRDKDSAMLLSGQKSVDVRLLINGNEYMAIKEGDYINYGGSLRARVAKVERYTNLRDCLEMLLNEIDPTQDSVSQAIRDFEEIYTPAEINNAPCLAFHLEDITPLEQAA